MGFLLGAFGKLAAGRRYRELQARGMRVQSQLRRVTKQVEDMEKRLQQGEATAKNQINAEYQSRLASFYNTAAISKDSSTDDIQTKQQEYQKMQANLQAYQSWAIQQLADQVEQQREQLLQPLKDKEDMLQLENDTIKSQIEIAKQDYEACQKMEQDGVKMLQPSYTAGGN
jgi:hypothetical protein